MTKTALQSKQQVACIHFNLCHIDNYPFDNSIVTNLEPKNSETSNSDDFNLNYISSNKYFRFLSNFTLKQLEPKSMPRNVSDAIFDEVPRTKLYKKRFWMLFLFSTCSMLNAMPWIQYSVVTDITMCYYNVDVFAVNWTSLLYMILYIPLVFPVSWFLDRWGLRISLLVGSFGTCLSAIIQCLSLDPDGFPIVLVAQTVASIAQVFILALPPKLAAVWFGPNEVSRACAVGVFGNQLGSALGFIFAPLVTSNDCANKSLIRQGKAIVAYTLTACNTLLFILLLATFESEPQIPPSSSEANKDYKPTSYKQVVLNLLKNFNFDRLLISYGLISGAYFALATILNGLILPHFPGQETAIGWMGVTAIAAGLVGSILAGYILDYSHKFKETSVAVFVLSLISMVAFTGLLHVEALWVQFLSITVLGFFLTSYLPIGFEFASEITYPEPEGTTAGLMNTSSMLFGIVLTMLSSYLLQNYGDIAANLFLCSVILVGAIVSTFTDCDLRRREQNVQTNTAQSQAHNTDSG